MKEIWEFFDNKLIVVITWHFKYDKRSCIPDMHLSSSRWDKVSSQQYGEKTKIQKYHKKCDHKMLVTDVETKSKRIRVQKRDYM